MPGSELEVEIIGPDGVPVGVVRRPPPPPNKILLHVCLFAIALLLATIQVGSESADLTGAWTTFQRETPLFHPKLLGLVIAQGRVWRDGLLFSIPLFAILLAHEFGHYIACRIHRLDATLPFFLPVPFGVGTLGAFIRIRTPLLTKRELFDVGASGPIAGFLVALPVLVIGIAHSHPALEAPKSGETVVGTTLLFEFLTNISHRLGPNSFGLELHPMAFAGWFGLLVTALNLLPFGQLDGGHVTYALFGRRQRQAAWPLLGLLLVLGFLWPGWWLWALIAIALRVSHPWIPEEATPLDPMRKLLGWFCILIFAICFSAQPIGFVR